VCPIGPGTGSVFNGGACSEKQPLQICSNDSICNIYVLRRKYPKELQFLYVFMIKEVKEILKEIIIFGMLIAN